MTTEEIVKSIDELAAERGVHPITDPDTLRGKNIWPEDDDIDEFVDTVQRWRREGNTPEEQR